VAPGTSSRSSSSRFAVTSTLKKFAALRRLVAELPLALDGEAKFCIHPLRLFWRPLTLLPAVIDRLVGLLGSALTHLRHCPPRIFAVQKFSPCENARPRN